MTLVDMSVAEVLEATVTIPSAAFESHRQRICPDVGG